MHIDQYKIHAQSAGYQLEHVYKCVYKANKVICTGISPDV